MIWTQALMALSMTAAQPAPEHVKSVFEHYFHGQGKGAVLAEAFLCKKIETLKGDAQNDCLEVASDAGTKGDKVDVYMTFLVPKGDEAELMVQAVHNNVVRTTRDVKVNGTTIRYRTWRSFTLEKPGKWEFRIVNPADGSTLKALAIDVP
jgi:hypothetical protein